MDQACMMYPDSKAIHQLTYIRPLSIPTSESIRKLPEKKLSWVRAGDHLQVTTPEEPYGRTLRWLKRPWHFCESTSVWSNLKLIRSCLNIQRPLKDQGHFLVRSLQDSQYFQTHSDQFRVACLIEMQSSGCNWPISWTTRTGPVYRGSTPDYWTTLAASEKTSVNPIATPKPFRPVWNQSSGWTLCEPGILPTHAIVDFNRFLARTLPHKTL